MNNGMSKSMIFHCPFPIAEQGKSGSQVRPFQMWQAFQAIGYEVEAVVGYERQRAVVIDKIKTDIRKGRKFDFVYSESATVPTLLTERLRHHKHPSLDYAFWAWLRRQAVPISLFYRDIFWRTAYRKIAQTWRDQLIKTPLYWYDWFAYRWLVDYLFLPSLEMAAHLPTQWPAQRVQALPPGCNISDAPTTVKPDETSADLLHLFYVGSIVLPFYDLKPVIEMIGTLDNVSWTICCRADEWQQSQAHYLPLPTERVRVVHAAGEQLRSYYESADAFLLIWKPNPYLDFAMPVKLFEALGYGLPMIVNEGLRASRFVAEEDTGWVVATDDALPNTLVYLSEHPEELLKKREYLKQVRTRHTWAMRAQQVANVMKNLKR